MNPQPPSADTILPSDEGGPVLPFPPLSQRVSSAARSAAEAWAAAMQQRKQPCTMAPWDEQLYCLNPSITRVILTAGTNIQVARPNPQRVGIIFSPQSYPAANLFLQPFTPIDPGTPSGIIMESTGTALMFLQQDWLNLVQVEWFAYNTVTGQALTVIEIVLKDWPKR